MEADPSEESCRGAEIPASASSSCKKPQIEDSDVSSTDDQDELLPRPVRKKRPNRRYTEWSSDDEYCLRALKRSFPKYKEANSSSESESDFTRPARDSALKPTGLPIGVVRGCPKCSDCQAVLARWRPEEGCRPSVDEAPVFYPTAEEFKDTLKYISKIRPAAEPFGICRVVPPPGWRPPCPLREDTVKLHVLKFPTRVQEIHKLQVRRPVKKSSQAKQRLGGRRGRGGLRGRMGRPCRRTSNPLATGVPAKSMQPDESFGFEPGSYFSLSMFEKYAQQFKEQYFFQAEVVDELQSQPETTSESPSRMNPSVDAIEAEYWRIVERPTEQIEVLYGADVETGSFGSGFPKVKAGDAIMDLNSYEKSGWNLNNIARLPGSMLAFEEGDISGVLVPWLYIGMCFSSFCWHVEDHHFYSLNYLHWGAPKVWYGVAGYAAHDMEVAMKKHLPDLFDEQPDLLHKLVTQLSPSILKGEGLPVYRLVQQAGEFVITFPRAYHSGFNCGFNCAEAVNLAPVDWLPHGQSAVELYREQRRKTSVSHDKLLLAAAREAVKVLRQSRNQVGPEKHEGQVVKQEIHGQWEKKGAAGGAMEIAYAWQAFCGHGGALVKALKARVELERFRQASLTGEVQMRKMDRRYDATDERECAECHYDLHLSAVGCVCRPDKYVCLEHASILCMCQWGRKFVMYRYDLVQLQLLVAALEDQPGALDSWFEQEQCFSSSSCVSTHALFPRQDLGLCKFNSSEFPLGEGGSNGQNIESCLTNYSDCLALEPKILGSGGNLPHQISRGACSQSIAPVEVLPVPQLVAAVVGNRMLNTVRIQRRGSVGISCQVKKLENTFAKVEVQVPERSILSSRKEVIVLSDDEEGTLTSSGVEFSAITKSHEGNTVRSHVLSTTTPFSDPARSDTLSTLSLSTDAGGGHIVTPLEGELFVSYPLTNALSLPLKSVGSVVPQSSLKMPLVSQSHLPSRTPAPPVRTHLSGVATMEDSPVISSPPARVRSIGNLKQQARAASTQHMGSGLRPASFRADHLQRLQSGQEMPGAELCGHVATPDTQPPACFQGGNAVQSCTPLRLDRPAGPRVAKVVRRKVYCEVELLNVGSLILRKGWHDKHSIYPAGFRSRTSFCDVLDISQTCFYVSEVVECGQTGPRFKVLAECNGASVFVDDSIDMCWQAVQEKINAEIIRRRGIGETNLPPLQPPQSIHGLDMFGLSSATIVQAVEALDPQHQCHEYWTAKLRTAPLAGYYPPAYAYEHRPSTPEELHVLRSNLIGANEEVTSKPTTPTPERLASKGTKGEYSSSGNVDLYGVFKGFFLKGRSDELWALHQLFSCDWQGKEWREGFQALTDVLEARKP